MAISPQAVGQSRSQNKVRAQALPSPIGGWNARDSLDQMNPEDAVVLENLIPEQGRVVVRNGYTQFASNLQSDVETLVTYHAGTTQTLLAASNGNIWDISNGGSSPTSLGSGFASDRWQWAAFEGEIGLVNGQDTPQVYDGSTLSNMSVSGNGLTVANLIGINVFKSRTYFWEENSQDFWYSSVNALGGSLAKFPLSRVGQFGGNLVGMGTWTRDGGEGMNDQAVFVMSSGEVIIYQGSDPGTAADWSLVGIFQIGEPVAIRGLQKFGGDLILITTDGYMPMSQALRGRISLNSAVSNKIQDAVVSAVQEYGANYGWEITLYPQGRWLIFNVPIATNATYVQHVMNTVTGQWTKFTGMNARTWVVHDNDLYFGENGKVFKADVGFNDDGKSIKTDAWTAYTYLGSRTLQKLLTGVQPVLESDGEITVSLAVEPDFRRPKPPFNTASSSAEGAEWDIAEWNVAKWAGNPNILQEWSLMSGLGYTFAFRMRASINNQTLTWYSTNYLFQPAGVI